MRVNTNFSSAGSKDVPQYRREDWEEALENKRIEESYCTVRANLLELLVLGQLRSVKNRALG